MGEHNIARFETSKVGLRKANFVLNKDGSTLNAIRQA
jgi:hypothetical protein